ncbi:MAG: RNA-binding protein [Oscillospiraceae bacterium]
MTKTELLNRCARNADDRLVLARVLDKLERAERRAALEHTAFLSPAERAAAEDMLKLYGTAVRYTFFGGYAGAERCVCVFLPDWMRETFLWENEQSPVAAIGTELYSQANLTHRDILGSLMGLGLTREKIGDILISNRKCQVLLLREVLDIVLSQWVSVGRYKISAKEIPLTALEAKPPEVREIRDTVAALRLDSVLASGFSLPRSRASALIASGRVSLNHREVLKPDKSVAEGDVLSCRGLGKCTLREITGKSRKDRIIIIIDRYL